MSLVSSFNELSQKERLYVESRLTGMTQIASATAAGFGSPKKHASEIDARPQVQKALLTAMEATAEEVGFSRKEAHDLLMSAYYNADTATEQIAAVRELIKLHGIAAPVKVEHTHEHQHSGELHLLSNDELMKLADMDDLVIDAEFEEVARVERLELRKATDGEQVSTAQEALPDV